MSQQRKRNVFNHCPSSLRATTYQRTAASFNNPDFVDIVIHSYRHRLGYAPGDPIYENIEQQLAAQPKIPDHRVARGRRRRHRSRGIGERCTLLHRTLSAPADPDSGPRYAPGSPGRRHRGGARPTPFLGDAWSTVLGAPSGGAEMALGLVPTIPIVSGKVCSHPLAPLKHRSQAARATRTRSFHPLASFSRLIASASSLRRAAPMISWS
jgi:hypothetical protein